MVYKAVNSSTTHFILYSDINLNLNPKHSFILLLTMYGYTLEAACKANIFYVYL
jgi:hypothetical protein